MPGKPRKYGPEEKCGGGPSGPNREPRSPPWCPLMGIGGKAIGPVMRSGRSEMATDKKAWRSASRFYLSPSGAPKVL